MATVATTERPIAGAEASDTRFFGHPRGLSTLFFTEMWERFSYYGMRALLILFMTATVAQGGLGFDTGKAGVIYGTYVALAYLTSLPGGWLGDRLLGQRRATFLGGAVLVIGHLCLAMPSGSLFFPGLLLIVTGTGLLKPNASVMVGQLYSKEDARRDAGFSIYYMGINLGGFLAPLVCGWFAQSAAFRGTIESWGFKAESAWHWGFGMAALGMTLGLIQYVLGSRHLGEVGLTLSATTTEEVSRDRRTLWIGVSILLGGVALVVLLAALGIIRITPEGVGRASGVALFGSAALLFGWLFLFGKWTPDERKRLIVVFVLFLASCVFWSVLEQAGSTLNLFAQRSTRSVAFGHAFPPSWFQSMESFFLILSAPVLAWLWIRLGKRDPSSPAKFAAGLVFVAAGFGILIFAAKLTERGIQVSPWWLTGTYFLHAIGELCLSPVGLSAATKLAPARVAGLIMGVYFLGISIGNYGGGVIASLYDKFSLPTLFTTVTLYSLVAGLIVAVLVKPMRRMLARA